MHNDKGFLAQPNNILYPVCFHFGLWDTFAYGWDFMNEIEKVD